MSRIAIFCAAAFLVLPALALAAGGHDGLTCTGCHSVHDAKGDIIFAVAANAQAANPATGEPYGGTTALCLGCHSADGRMGILPVAGKSSHPFGIVPNPQVAAVPKELHPTRTSATCAWTRRAVPRWRPSVTSAIRPRAR